MTPSKNWPIGFEFQIDVCQDVYRVVDGGVEVYDCWKERWDHIIPFGSKEFRETFAGRRTYGTNQKLIDGFIDGEAFYR